MCGILYTDNIRVSQDRFKEALTMMNHRGPDASGYIVYRHHQFGHRRLSILDLNDRSNQPFIRNGRVIIFNGEIYNYQLLIREHKLKVQTESDTEVILAMYEKYKENCLEFFNGMFAFVIYDDKTGDQFVARDRLGVKPLYVHGESRGSLTLSSEIAPLIKLFGKDFDEFGIRQYRKLRMTLNGYTIYKNIKTFPPAHYWKNGRFIRYWDIDVATRAPPEDEQLKYLLEDAVAIRKISDVPVGSYLSGGLDSTVITYLLKPPHVWTVGFKDSNEFYWARLAAENFNIRLHETLVNKDSFIKTAKFMIDKRQEPLSVPNEVLLFLMTKDVKTRNTVVLSGEGADELFWGYDRIFKWANKASIIDLHDFDKLYCYGSNKDDEVLSFALESVQGNNPIEKMAYFFQIHHLQGLLRRLDNSTMLCSVEARTPFVDYRLVELMAGAPFDWRMGDTFKQPLKSIYSKLIPESIINRPKVGFPVPLDRMYSIDKKQNAYTSMDKWLVFNLKQIVPNYKGY